MIGYNWKLMETDRELLEQLRLGSEKAFEALYWRYNERIYHFVYSLLFDKSLAEDVTQNIFLKIWERREGVDPSRGIDAYLFTIARHLVYKTTERMLRIESYLDLENMGDTDDGGLGEQELEAASLRRYIERLVELMPSARQEIFRLSRFRHLPNKEIANRLSISEKTVETQLYRALRFLRERLSDDGFLGIIILLFLNES